MLYVTHKNRIYILYTSIYEASFARHIPIYTKTMCAPISVHEQTYIYSIYVHPVYAYI